MGTHVRMCCEEEQTARSALERRERVGGLDDDLESEEEGVFGDRAADYMRGGAGRGTDSSRRVWCD